MTTVIVNDGNVEQALKVFKKKVQRKGTLREARSKEAYEKPTTRRKRKKEQRKSRSKKALIKKAQSEGIMPAKKRIIRKNTSYQSAANNES